MIELSVKLNEMFGGDVATEEMVERAAAAGADAVGYRPWYGDLDNVLDAAATAGVDVAYISGGSQHTSGPEFQLTHPEKAADAITEIEQAITVASTAGVKNLNVIPGRREHSLDPATQHNSIVTALRTVADRAESEGVTLLVEPINAAVDAPGIYLTSSYEGYQIINAVDSPNVRLLYDVYHQQITEGNIIANLRTHLDRIGYIHIADVPGRHEPGTGEINYRQVFDTLIESGYRGYIGCEFHPLAEPETTIRQVATLLGRDQER